MAYTKTVWKNGQAPALNETNMNKIENGIYNNDAAIATLNSAVAGKATASPKQITLAAASWSGKTQNVTLAGVTTTNSIVVSPVPSQQDAYSEAAILCTAQAANRLTFTCEDVPSDNIVVNVLIVD